jgi:hypothetical protein
VAALQEKIRRAQQSVDREKAQAQQAGVQTALSFGATLLSAFMGRKAVSASSVSKAATALKGVGRTVGQATDVGRAQETVGALQQQLEELNTQFKEESDALASKIDPTTEVLDTVSIVPKKTDISVQLVALAWVPFRSDAQGQQTPAW